MAGGTESTSAVSPRFAVDRMLGRLARWLRVLGHDVVYEPQLSGRRLADRARREGRVLVTRDTRLRPDPGVPAHVFVISDHFREQLREVAAAVPLAGGALLGRCLDCNRPLAEVPKGRVEGRVPPFVWATQERFLTCSGCHRVYWDATHRTAMLRELTALGLVGEESDARLGA
jgi:uncharacterized protein with PIN domain